MQSSALENGKLLAVRTANFQMFKMDLEKEEELEIKPPI